MIAILLLTAALSAGTGTTGAVCIGGIPLAKAAETHPLIFEGEVTGEPSEMTLKNEQLPGGRTLRSLGLRIEMKVREVWAGTPPASLEIIYTHHAQDIHGRFDAGERFIVWAYRYEGRWTTSDCSPTIERERATPEMLRFLATLRK